MQEEGQLYWFPRSIWQEQYTELCVDKVLAWFRSVCTGLAVSRVAGCCSLPKKNNRTVEEITRPVACHPQHLLVAGLVLVLLGLSPWGLHHLELLLWCRLVHFGAGWQSCRTGWRFAKVGEEELGSGRISEGHNCLQTSCLWPRGITVK